MKIRLRAQYTVTIAGLVFLTALVLSSVLYQEHQIFSRELEAATTAALSRAMQRQAETQGLALAQSLAERLAESVSRMDTRFIGQEVAETKVHPEVTSIHVLDAQGRILSDGSLQNLSFGQAFAPAWLNRLYQDHKQHVSREPGMLRVGVPVLEGSQLLGAVAIDFARAPMLESISVERTNLLGMLQNAWEWFLLVSTSVSVILLCGAILAAVALAQGLAQPIQALVRRARAIGSGNRDVAPETAPETKRNDELGDLARAFDDMAVALRHTTVSKDYVDNILQSMAEMLIVTDSSQRIVTANRACLRELGRTEEAIHGLPIDRLLPQLTATPPASERPQAPNAAADDDAARRADAAGANGDGGGYFALVRPDGTEVPVQVSVSPLREHGDSLVGHVYVMQNVTERLAAQQQSERSLREKETLLKEVHHRVKNNLQIISSMLSLQANRSNDETMRNVFMESENRIRAMALIHEQLYRAEDLARVDMGAYLESLSARISRSVGSPGYKVDVQVDPSLREAPVDMAIPLGLIVNELLSNSARHAFPGGRGGNVRVRLRQRGPEHEIEVSDDGVGLPADFDAGKLPTLGFKLVQALVEQLRGRLEVIGNGGVTLRAVFPATAMSQRTQAAAEV